MRRFLCFLTLFSLVFLLFCPLPHSLAEPLPPYPHAFSGQQEASFQSPSLIWQIERFDYEGGECLLTKVWLQDPGRQIGKATADWEQSVLPTLDIAKRAPEASLLINGSGYVTARYSWIPDNYPGRSEDYYFTPLGSLTVSGGRVYRLLENVPFYGLTLQKDGLHIHSGEDPLAVLAHSPSETWSFYVECPFILDHQSHLDPAWRFTDTRAMRTIIAKMDQNNYILLTVTRKGGGLTMAQCTALLLTRFDPEWAYNLDGGPSSALMYRDDSGQIVPLWENTQENADILYFFQLPSP